MTSDQGREPVEPPFETQDLEAIIHRFRAPLLSFFGKRARDRQEADDLVQELFCRLAARSGTLRMENPDAYIFQMAANLLRDHARRQSTRNAADRALSEQSTTSFEEISPERVLLGRRRLAEVRKALAELPERTRAIFILHRFEELKYSEIAQRLGISKSSVEKHMMDAIRYMVERLERP
jgi:RNA polymerase sigma-70 factor (ECF subfamily)